MWSFLESLADKFPHCIAVGIAENISCITHVNNPGDFRKTQTKPLNKENSIQPRVFKNSPQNWKENCNDFKVD